jgi:hypothetical protein
MAVPLRGVGNGLAKRIDEGVGEGSSTGIFSINEDDNLYSPLGNIWKLCFWIDVRGRARGE